MSDQNDDLFSQEMGDVTPLSAEVKVQLKRDDSSALARQARRQSAQVELQQDNNHLSSDYVEMLDAHYLLEFKRPGVQHGVFRKLKQGKYPQDARLDLHRMTVEVARKEVFAFINEAQAYDIRSLIIVHGKGSHGESDKALLKSYVNKWLPDMEAVQAYCSARPHHGGVGAVYVLLRKSENKQDDQEGMSKGRVI